MCKRSITVKRCEAIGCGTLQEQTIYHSRTTTLPMLAGNATHAEEVANFYSIVFFHEKKYNVFHNSISVIPSERPHTHTRTRISKDSVRQTPTESVSSVVEGHFVTKMFHLSIELLTLNRMLDSHSYETIVYT